MDSTTLFPGTLTIQTFENGTYVTRFMRPDRAPERKEFMNLFTLVDYLKETSNVVTEWEINQQFNDEL